MATENNAKILEFTPDLFYPGDQVYLTEDYYIDTDASVLEVPRYGWKIKAYTDGVCQIEYQRPNWKLLMSIMCETKYLKREL